MKNFCTLFDKNYLLFGMALHRSLIDNAMPFRLYALAMDDECEEALKALALEHVVVVCLGDVITADYAFIREQMSFGQMCWTCQPLLCRHVLDRHHVDAVTYLEADSYFFADPAALFDEIGERSVSLVPHNYAPGYDQTEKSGIYCVQFNMFRNDEPSRRLLAEWEAACLKYDRRSPRHFPGQLCLDGWPQRSSAVWVVRHPGAGVAPWNAARFRFGAAAGRPTVDGVPIVFYHYHELAFMDGGNFFLSSYGLNASVIDAVYRPYVDELVRCDEQLRRAVPGFDHRKRFRSPGAWRSMTSFDRSALRSYAKYLYSLWRGRKNIIRPRLPREASAAAAR
jgi:hypothetical protein